MSKELNFPDAAMIRLPWKRTVCDLASPNNWAGLSCFVLVILSQYQKAALCILAQTTVHIYFSGTRVSQDGISWKKEQNTRRTILQTSINSRWNRNPALLLTEVPSSFSVLSYAHPTRTADTSQQKQFVVSLQSFLNAVLGQCSFITSLSSQGSVQHFCWPAWGIWVALGQVRPNAHLKLEQWEGWTSVGSFIWGVHCQPDH